MRSIAAIALLLAACSVDSSDLPSESRDTAFAYDPHGPDRARVDVIPSQLLDANGDFRALPQTLGFIDLPEGGRLGDVDLQAPQILRGRILAEMVTPIASGASLPTVQVPLVGELRVVQPDSVQRYVTRTDAEGAFSAVVVPDDLYDLVVVPDDPMLPFVVRPLAFGPHAPELELDLAQGVPVWGRVTGPTGEGLEEVEVHAYSPSGVRGTSTLTDAQGRYLLYVQPDAAYEIVTSGQRSRRQPHLRSPVTQVGADGAEIDFVYPDLSPVFRSVTVTGEGGQALGGVRVRFTSKSLAGYVGQNAQFVAEATTFDGHCDVRLIDGIYQVEILPPTDKDPARDHTPVLLPEIVLADTPEIPKIVLPAFVEVRGTVLSTWGDRVPGAQITCAEYGFEHRQWTTHADVEGDFRLLLPQTPVECAVTPPGDHQHDFALTRTHLDPAQVHTEPLVLPLVPGAVVEGTVRTAGRPEANAVVEVRAPDGRLLGSTLTQGDGWFSLRVAAALE